MEADHHHHHHTRSSRRPPKNQKDRPSVSDEKKGNQETNRQLKEGPKPRKVQTKDHHPKSDQIKKPIKRKTQPNIDTAKGQKKRKAEDGSQVKSKVKVIKKTEDEKIQEKKLVQLKKEIKKIESKSDSIKTIDVLVDKSIVEESLCTQSNLKEQLSEGGCGLKIAENPVSNSVIWVKNKSIIAYNANSEPFIKTTQNDENQIMVFIDNILVITLATQSLGRDREESSTFYSYVKNLKKRVKYKVLTVILYDLETYFKNEKNKDNIQIQKQLKHDIKGKKIKSDQQSKPITAADIDSVVVDAFIHLNNLPDYQNSIRFLKVDNSLQAAKLIYHYTKSISYAHHKKETLNDYKYLDSKPMIANLIDERDITKVWKYQLMLMQAIDEDVAGSITLEYPNPQALRQAYLKMSVEEGEDLLKEITVLRNRSKSSEKIRKVGSKVSKLLHLLFTSKNAGEKLLE